MKLSQNEKIKISQLALDSVANGQTCQTFAESVCALFGCDWSFDLYALAQSEYRKQRQNFEECNF